MSNEYKVFGLDWYLVTSNKLISANTEQSSLYNNGGTPFILFRDICDVLEEVNINPLSQVYRVRIEDKNDVISTFDNNDNNCIDNVDFNHDGISYNPTNQNAIDSATTEQDVLDLHSQKAPIDDIDLKWNIAELSKVIRNDTLIKRCKVKRVNVLRAFKILYYVVVGETYYEGDEVSFMDCLEFKAFASLSSLRNSINAGPKGALKWRIFRIHLGDILEYIREREHNKDNNLNKIPLLKFKCDVLSILNSKDVSHLE